MNKLIILIMLINSSAFAQDATFLRNLRYNCKRDCNYSVQCPQALSECALIKSK